MPIIYTTVPAKKRTLKRVLRKVWQDNKLKLLEYLIRKLGRKL